MSKELRLVDNGQHGRVRILPGSAVYDRNAYMKEKRAALDAWVSLLVAIVNAE